MSSKAKKAQQEKLRKRNKAKQLNRVRGMAHNLNLTDAEAEFYQRALASKATPAEMVNEIVADIRNVLANFDSIGKTACEPDIINALRVSHPTQTESIIAANQYLIETAEDLNNLEAKYLEQFEGLDNSKDSFLTTAPAMEEFSELQSVIAQNAENLMAVVNAIMTIYFELEIQFPGEVENDN